MRPSSSPVAANRDEPTVPAGVLFPLLELVTSWQVSVDELLGPFGLSRDDFAQPQARFPRSLYIAVVERARALTGEPALGLFWGLQMRMSTFGYLGFALMTTDTLRGAIELAIQFTPLGSTAEAMHLCVEGSMASLVLDEHPDSGAVRDVVGLSRIVALWKIAESITGRSIEGTADVSFDEPPYYRAYADRFPAVRFGQPKMRMVMKADVLDYPLVMANPVARELATEQCARELGDMNTDGRLLRAVRGLLWTPSGAVRTQNEIAKAAHMSPRTLRRKLTDRGTSLSRLLDEDRRDRALLLLRTSELSVAEIAVQLGYRFTQGFERAFRRWTGATPATYRRS